ncbi:MAG: sulfite exporter TauE/SafE family protein [Pseudomonadota bacterium]
MPPEIVAGIAAAMLLAAFVKGVTGLGFSTSALPMLVLIVDIRGALPLLIIPSLASNAMVMAQAGHLIEMGRRFLWLYAAALVGVAIGLGILAGIDQRVAGGVLGVVLLAYAGFAALRPSLRLPARLERPLGPPVGLLTGIVNGVTGSQVMPILPYLMALGLEPSRFVQAINISFTLSSIAMALGLSRLGLMTGENALLSLICLVPVFAGVRLGAAVRARLGPDRFRLAVLALLGLSGVVLIGRGLI